MSRKLAIGMALPAFHAAHPGGTVKIGEYLDTDLKTKYDNLYVCDASVIPDEMGLPPSFAILSMGKRLSKHLLGLDKAAPEKISATVVTQP